MSGAFNGLEEMIKKRLNGKGLDSGRNSIQGRTGRVSETGEGEDLVTYGLNRSLSEGCR